MRARGAVAAGLVAAAAGLDDWAVAWQSAGRTPEPWLGPDVRDVVRGLAAAEGATHIPVGALTTEEAEDLLRARLGPERLAAEPRAVGQLIGHCAGLPLALSIIAARMLHLSQREAEGFYAVHRERPFFRDLVRYMTSGPVIVQVLEGEGAIAKNREIMGAPDPKKAAPGTIRADLARSIEQNVVHGSDAADTAAREIVYFFSSTELHPRG